MGRFAVAAVFGFLLFWTWRNLLRDELRASDGRLGIVFGPALPVFAAALLAVVLLVWAWFAASRGLSIVDVIGRGTVARALLGIVVGFGLGYAIEHRILVAGAPKGARSRSKGGERSGGTSALLTVGFGAVLLALASPHLDRWLSRLTSLKSPIIELQLGSVASHKVSVTEGAAELNDVASLKSLSTYARAIDQDIEFAQIYGRSNQAQLGTSRELLPAFTYLISPIAGCMQTAIDNGLSISSARQMLRPMTDNLALLVFNENNPRASTQHEMFWKQLLALPEAIQDFLDNKKDVCLGYQKKYQECVENPEQDPICPPYAQKNPGSVTYPRIRDYRNLPYLYVAASLLFSFMTDDDSALRVLHVAEANIGASGNKALAFKDYSFLQSAGQLSYYLGKPGDIGSSYFDYLEKMRTTASGRVATLQGALESCADSTCKQNVGKMLRRHWIAQLLATNKLATYLAEDLARDSGNAFNYVARVEEYAIWLEKADDEGTKREAIDKYYAVPNSFKYYIMDTYLYVYLVLEARKTNADVEKFRKLKAQFQQVVEHIEDEAAKTPNFKKIQLTLVKIVRAHLASARELAGE